MNTSLYISSGALNTFQRKLDTVGHNVSNVNTIGYKRRETAFSENLANELNNQIVKEREQGRLTPHGIRIGYGVHLGQTKLNMEQGSAQETGVWTDAMIDGKGFFQVQRDVSARRDGSTVETRFTRDGSFKLLPSGAGDSNFLVSTQGDRLLDQDGQPIEIPNGFDVKILDNGSIQLTNKVNAADVSLAGQRIGLVDIANPQLLQNVGDNQYVFRQNLLRNGDTPDRWIRIMDLDAEPSMLRQGFLETSNVNMALEMNDLILSQRGFQMNARAVAYADQMMGMAIGIMK